MRLIGTGLGTVQVGNEPDLLSNVRPGYTEAGYRADVAAYRASIAAVAPGTAVSGPDTALPARLASYAADEGAAVAFLTQHFYPLTRCDGRRPTIDQLLSASTLDTEARLAGTTVGGRPALSVCLSASTRRTRRPAVVRTASATRWRPPFGSSNTSSPSPNTA